MGELVISYYDFKPVEDHRRSAAVLRLWNAAAAEVDIVHPDVNVRTWIEVEPNSYFEYTDRVRVKLFMEGVRNTSDMDRRLGSKYQPFYMAGSPECWPGYKLAREYIACLWATYMVHESLELVTLRGIPKIYNSWYGCHEPKRVVNPHGNAAHEEWLSKLELRHVLGFAYGLGGSLDEAVSLGVALGEQEVLNEIDPWVPGT